MIEQVKAGNLRALGISATERVPGIDIPTLREQGADVSFSNWRGVAAPPKLSDAQRQEYLALIDKVVKSPSWKDHLEKNGWVDSYLPGDAFRAYITEETKRVTALLTTLGLIK